MRENERIRERTEKCTIFLKETLDFSLAKHCTGHSQKHSIEDCAERIILSGAAGQLQL